MFSQLVTSAHALGVATVLAIQNPNKGDAVAAVAELTAGPALRGIRTIMMADVEGRRILKNRPVVTDDLLTRALTLPPGTFGYAYAQYMSKNAFLPSGRPPVVHITDPTLRYVMQRFRETHDFIHAATGCSRSVEHEVALKMFEWYHTGLPIGVLAIVGGTPHLSRETFASVITTHRAWAFGNRPTARHGDRQVVNYMTVPWEQLLELPHEHVLALTGYTPFPHAAAS